MRLTKDLKQQILGAAITRSGVTELKTLLPEGLFDSNLRTESDIFVNVAGQRRRFWWCGAQYRYDA